MIVRVRGQHVQVLLYDSGGGERLADRPRRGRSISSEETPDEDEEEGEPMGDLGIVADLGISDFDMDAIIDNLDLSSDRDAGRDRRQDQAQSTVPQGR